MIVPVSDQDAAIAFYTETLGFSLVSDIPFGDGVFCLRLAPELIFVQSTEANAPIDNGAGGSVTSQTTGGTGFGMEAALDVKLAKLLGAGLQFRRSRVVAWRSSAIDEEWYVAVQAVLSL